ncbi:MAG TPA: hypothetical protein VFB40_15190 [Actinocrinis sp.]|nr:hypothetical protein [Actinocrinis sp.]HZP52515.1 hypothetical protein [Actinocrinis sp.]
MHPAGQAKALREYVRRVVQARGQFIEQRAVGLEGGFYRRLVQLLPALEV